MSVASSSGTKPFVTMSGPDSTLPVCRSIVSTTRKMPSLPIDQRSRMTDWLMSPTPRPSTYTTPEATFSPRRAPRSSISTESPLVMTNAFPGATPRSIAMRAWRTSIRYSPWTGMKYFGRRMLRSSFSSSWLACPDTWGRTPAS